MTLKKVTAKNFICLLLSAVLLFSFIPMLSVVKVSAEEDDVKRVADPSTMDDWKKFFLGDMLSTENAGGIWTDKSVFTNADDFDGIVAMQDEDNNFLVALSAVASNKSITGYSHVPTDTVFVLDVSRTMGENVRPGDNNNNAVSELVTSVNKSMDRLLSENKHNRVGVVLYSGTYSPDVHADSSNATVLLPLGRYEQNDACYLERDNHIFKVGETLLTAESIRINGSVTSEGVPVEQKEREVYGGSFIQGGVYSAMTEFLSTADTEISSEEFQSGTKRLPVIVLMSDGLATSATTHYMGDGESIGTSDLGNGTTPEDELSTAIPFVTQLTCSYAKEKIEEHYGREALFYTLGYKVESTPVLDPQNTTTDTHWDTYNVTHIGEFMQLAIKSTWINNGWWGEGHWDTEYKAIEKSSYDLKKDYVDKYYHTETSLENTFDAIIDEIAYKSLYYPTQVDGGNTDLDGYVEFIDDIGEFMEVKKVHGILLGDILFTGDNIAGNFIPGGGGGSLGSIDKPSSLGDELIRSVKARLGITETKTAQELVREAFMSGQLYHNPQTREWSNFIGWYENAEGAYIGHGTRYDEKPLEGAKYYNESYGYLGKVIDGHNSSDMMYVSVRLRTEIETGKTAVIFRVPASLIPVITYDVSLTGDSVKNPGEVTLKVDDTMSIDTDNDGVYDEEIPVSPIRLLFEVGIDDRINELNVSEIAGDGYKYTENGSYDFYVSRWNKDALEHEHPSLAENTVSFYEPSVENERYYYTENATVYKRVGDEYVPYEGEENPANYTEALYRELAVFEEMNDNEVGNGQVHLHYEQISQEALKSAKQDGAFWYIPKGTVHRMFSSFHAGKGGFIDESKSQVNSNNTDTLMYSHYLDVELAPESSGAYYADVILGNNGKISLKQAQGIKIFTDSDVTLQKCNDLFKFEVKVQNTEITESCTLTTVDKFGSMTENEVVFEEGSLVVGLKAGESAYLTGLPTGAELFIAEVQDNNDHQVKSINGEEVTSIILTVEENAVAAAEFMNELASPVGCGAIIIQGTVKHPYSEDYLIPEDIKFIYDVAYTNTDGEELSEQITLSAGEIYHITDIALGTVATVTEAKINPGFKCEYPTHSREISVEKEENYIVFFNNTYTPESISPNVTVTGDKEFYGRENNQWLQSDVFTFKLQKFSGNEWVEMVALDDNALKPVSASVTKDNQDFDFSSAVKAEVYTEPGVYSYRVIEDIPENPKDGISYDKSVRWFDIFVTDKDMDGRLEVDKVVPYMGTTADFNEETLTWEVKTSFTNTYLIMGSDEVKISVNTRVVDNTNGTAEKDELSLSGYEYALYQNDRLVAVLPATNEEGNTHITLSYGAFDIGKHIHYVLKLMDTQEPVPDMVYSDTEYHIVVDVTDDTKGGVYAQLTATSSEEGAEVVVGNEIEVEFVNTYGSYTPPVTEPTPSTGTEPEVMPTVPEASEGPTSSADKPEDNQNPDVPETGSAFDNILWIMFIALVIVGAVGIFAVGKRK